MGLTARTNEPISEMEGRTLEIIHSEQKENRLGVEGSKQKNKLTVSEIYITKDIFCHYRTMERKEKEGNTKK